MICRLLVRASELAGMNPSDAAALAEFRKKLDSLDAEYRKAALP
ncbi:MAG TPA: hypothetical protein VKB88_28060 [Bryobacteraceae bacterium]|nr:hypothetical protein [Bryobacteraceae bacterium]